MTTLPLLKELASPALVRSVGFALLHSLWQGGVLALLLAGVLPLLRRRRAEVRYAAAAGALASLLLSVGLTFGSYYHATPSASPAVEVAPPGAPAAWQPAAPVSGHAAPVASPAAPAAWAIKTQTLETYLPLVVGAWLLGLLLMSGRLAGGLLVAGRLRRVGTQALGAEWQQRLAALARRAGVRRPVALLESARVASPLVLGHLRPAILLPLGAVAGLSPALLEALLAHELAHIVRRDYLLNLGLAVAEVLFFYHPAVWFMAACLRAERENCCDDQAAALCGGDGLRVARALAALAELEATAGAVPRLALAAAGAGGRGSLLARVRRLALGRPQAPTLGEGLLAGSLALLGLLGLSTGVVLAARPTKLVAASKQTHPAAASPADTARPRAAAALIAVPVPPAPPAAPLVEEVAPAAAAGDVHLASPLQEEPPRRGRASTVVIEKDKKGRVVNLLVDGQPVEMAAPGKAGKRPKPVRQVEVVQVPAPLARPDRQSFSFGFSSEELTNQARQQARRRLAQALRDPDLNAEQRREMERELQKATKQWHIYANAQLADLNRSLKTYRFDLNGLAEGDRNTARRNSRFEVRSRAQADTERQAERAAEQAERAAEQADRAAEQADHDADQADRDAGQADRDAEQADRDDQDIASTDASRRAELAARRAELRARMAATAAELRALDTEARLAPPRPPRAPRVPQAPQAPQGPAPLPPPPAPPAPNTNRLREELRRDGLIKNEKHFSFELNDEGGRADGHALTPAQVEKYRQLLNQPASPGSKGRTRSTYSISINEH